MRTKKVSESLIQSWWVAQALETVAQMRIQRKPSLAVPDMCNAEPCMPCIQCMHALADAITVVLSKASIKTTFYWLIHRCLICNRYTESPFHSYIIILHNTSNTSNNYCFSLREKILPIICLKRFFFNNFRNYFYFPNELMNRFYASILNFIKEKLPKIYRIFVNLMLISWINRMERHWTALSGVDCRLSSVAIVSIVVSVFQRSDNSVKIMTIVWVLLKIIGKPRKVLNNCQKDIEVNWIKL